MLLNSDRMFAGFIRSSEMRRINSLLGAAFHGWAALRKFATIILCILIVMGGVIINSDVFSKSPGLGMFMFRLEKDKKAPVDYGFGPGAGIGPARPNLVLGQTPAIPHSTGLAPQAGPGTSVAPKAAAPAGHLASSVGAARRFWSRVSLADHTPSHSALARWTRLEFRHRPTGSARSATYL
jgi:hypothetical protein